MLNRRTLFGGAAAAAGVVALGPAPSAGAALDVGVTGNEITDATRAAGVEGDGRPAESSVGIYPATANLHPNGGFETDLSGWSALGDDAEIELSPRGPKFGRRCALVADGCESVDFAELGEGKDGTVSCWLAAEAGASFTLTVLDGTTVVAEDAELEAGEDWTRVALPFRPASTAPATLRVVRNGGGAFRLDGVFPEQSAIAATVDAPERGWTGHRPTPYVHRDDAAPPWPEAENVFPGGDLDEGLGGWAAFGAGATVSLDTRASYQGRGSIKVVTDDQENVGVRAERSFSVVGGQTYALDLRVDGPSGQAYGVEVRVEGERVEVDFAFTPEGRWGRKLLLFVAPETGRGDVVIGRQGTDEITFHVDSVRVWRRPDGAGEPVTPTGERGDGLVIIPAVAIVDPAQMWVAMRVRTSWGSDAHGAGSPVFFRWGDSDDARVEMYYSIRSDGWGVRRADAAGQVSAGPTAKEAPCGADRVTTLVGRWTPTAVAMSVDGSGFDAFARSSRDGEHIPTITTPTFSIGDVAGAAGFDLLWLAIGAGDLDDDDAALLHDLGDDAARGDIPGGKRLRLFWDCSGVGAWTSGSEA